MSRAVVTDRIAHMLHVERTQPHFVYRVYDFDGALLYIGCTRSPHNRFKTHRSQSRWFARAARAEWAAYPDFREARTAEREAIRSERPLFNRVHHPDRISPLAGSRRFHSEGFGTVVVKRKTAEPTSPVVPQGAVSV